MNGDLDKEIYVKLPPGYATITGKSLPPNVVCKFKKSIYGFKQTSRQWYKKFSDSLLLMGFIKGHSDHTLFVKNDGKDYVGVLVYVDDIVIASTSDEAACQVKMNLQAQYILTEKYFLGLEVARTEAGISLCQRKYALELLASTFLWVASPIRFQWNQI